MHITQLRQTTFFSIIFVFCFLLIASLWIDPTGTWRAWPPSFSSFYRCLKINVKKMNALLGSNGGIWFPITLLCGDPNWRTIFNTTHRRDERQQWADQRGCRGPIKLLEFTSCHHTIPATETPCSFSIKTRCSKSRDKNRYHNNNITKIYTVPSRDDKYDNYLVTNKHVSIFSEIQTDLITKQLSSYCTCLVMPGHLGTFSVNFFSLVFLVEHRFYQKDQWDLVLEKNYPFFREGHRQQENNDLTKDRQAMGGKGK